MRYTVAIFMAVILSVLTVACNASPKTEKDSSHSEMERITEDPDVSTNESTAPVTSEDPGSSDSQSVTEETKEREVFSEEGYYIYPITDKSPNWKNLSVKERVRRLRIDEETLKSMTDEQLVHAVVDYPLIVDIYVSPSGNLHDGIQMVSDYCDALKELLSRDNYNETLKIYGLQILRTYGTSPREDGTTDFSAGVIRDLIQKLCDEYPVKLSIPEERELFSSDGHYLYPVTKEDPEWYTFLTAEIHEALLINEDILEQMTDEQLVYAILDYPYLSTSLSGEISSDYLKRLAEVNLSALKELMNRESCQEALENYGLKAIEEYEVGDSRKQEAANARRKVIALLLDGQ